MANAPIGLIGAQAYFDALAALTGFPSSPDDDSESVADIEAGLSPTFKEQLVKARRGQGVFPANVMLVEEGSELRQRAESLDPLTFAVVVPDAVGMVPLKVVERRRMRLVRYMTWSVEELAEFEALLRDIRSIDAELWR